VCVICCDGLTALPDAIEATFADAWIQTCVVHLIRNSIKHVSYKDRRAVVADLKPIYRAATEDAAAEALEDFTETWDDRYPMIAQMWRWKSPGLTDTESEATLVVLGRKSECHVHIRLSFVDERSSWPGWTRSR